MAADPLHSWGTQVQGLNRFYNEVHSGVNDNTHPLVLHLLTAVHVILEKAEADVEALRLGNLTAKKEAAIRTHMGDRLVAASNLLHIASGAATDRARLLQALAVRRNPPHPHRD